MRQEFTKATKRLALRRSDFRCEAEGVLYGLPPDTRCNGGLSHGFDFDHILAASNGGDNSIQNCAVVCKTCHAFKTRKNDTPRAAKTVRISDKHLGIEGPRHKWAKRKFNQPRFDNTRYVKMDPYDD